MAAGGWTCSARSLGEAVEHDCHQREGDRHLEPLADLVARERVDDEVAEPAATGEPGDDDHRDTIMITWFTASTIAGSASGIRTPRSTWRREAPNVVAASIVGPAPAHAEGGDPDAEGDCVQDGGDDAARDGPDREDHHERDRVDERRDRLQRVEQR